MIIQDPKHHFTKYIEGLYMFLNPLILNLRILFIFIKYFWLKQHQCLIQLHIYLSLHIQKLFQKTITLPTNDSYISIVY